MIGEKCYVTAVKPGSDAEAKGLKEGDEIYTIDTLGPIRENFWKIQYLYHVLTPRTRIRLNVIKPDGKQQNVEVESRVVQGKPVVEMDVFFDLLEQREKDRLKRHRFHQEKEDLLIWKMPRLILNHIRSTTCSAGRRIVKRLYSICEVTGRTGADTATHSFKPL